MRDTREQGGDTAHGGALMRRMRARGADAARRPGASTRRAGDVVHRPGASTQCAEAGVLAHHASHSAGGIEAVTSTGKRFDVVKGTNWRFHVFTTGSPCVDTACFWQCA